MTIAGFCALVKSEACAVAGASTASALSTVTSEAHTGAMDCKPCQKTALCAVGLVAGGALIGYIVGTTLAARKARCNSKVQLDCGKVVDTVDVEDIGEKKAFCRCWKSSKFPYCDGTHGKHNKDTGDNVGPLIVKGKPAAQ